MALRNKADPVSARISAITSSEYHRERRIKTFADHAAVAIQRIRMVGDDGAAADALEAAAIDIVARIRSGAL